MKVAIIIQGRNVNFEKLVDSFSECDYKVLFCGWEDDEIKSKGNLEVLLLKKPDVILPMFCNYQSEGVLGGISYLVDKGYTHFLKLRWDMIPNKNDVNRLIELLVSKYVENNKPIFYSVSLNEKSMIQDWLLFGNKLDHLKYWQIKNNDVHGSDVAEHIFFFNLVKYDNLPLKLSDLSNIELITKYFDFCCKEILEKDIKIDMFVGNSKYTNTVDIKHYGTIDKTHITNY